MDFLHGFVDGRPYGIRYSISVTLILCTASSRIHLFLKQYLNFLFKTEILFCWNNEVGKVSFALSFSVRPESFPIGLQTKFVKKTL